MRRALLHFLLFSFLFNAAVGLPLHAAEHTRERAAQVVLEAAWAERATSAQAPEAEEASEVPTPCALCASFAQHGNASAQVAASVPIRLGAAQALPPPDHTLAFVPATERWPFASRDPPW